LEDLTGFRPKTALPQIIDRVIAYFESRRDSPRPRAAVGTSGGN
jgi:hypothetical protein